MIVLYFPALEHWTGPEFKNVPKSHRPFRLPPSSSPSSFPLASSALSPSPSPSPPPQPSPPPPHPVWGSSFHTMLDSPLRTLPPGRPTPDLVILLKP